MKNKKIIRNMYEKFAVNKENEEKEEKISEDPRDEENPWGDGNEFEDTWGNGESSESEGKTEKKRKNPFSKAFKKLFSGRNRKKTGREGEEKQKKPRKNEKKKILILSATGMAVAATAFLLLNDESEDFKPVPYPSQKKEKRKANLPLAKKAKTESIFVPTKETKPLSTGSASAKKSDGITLTEENKEKAEKPPVAMKKKITPQGKNRVRASTLYSLQKEKTVKLKKNPEKLSDREALRILASIPDEKIDVTFKKYSNERLNNAIMRYKKELERRFKEECEARKTLSPMAAKTPSSTIAGRVPVTVSSVRKSVTGNGGYISVVKMEKPSVGTKNEKINFSLLGGKRKSVTEKKKPPKPPWISLRITGYACDSGGCYVWTNLGRIKKGDVIGGGSFKVLSVKKNEILVGMIYDGKIAETRKFGSR